jgi:hypothetical protein
MSSVLGPDPKHNLHLRYAGKKYVLLVNKAVVFLI